MNLIEGIQEQQHRFRDELIPMYRELPQNAGMLALKLTLEPLLQESERAIASGDAVAMLRVLARMREVEE